MCIRDRVNAPEGYTINKNYVEIAVDANTAYQMDSESGDAIITVDYENHPVKGKMTIYKKGEDVYKRQPYNTFTPGTDCLCS